MPYCTERWSTSIIVLSFDGSSRAFPTVYLCVSGLSRPIVL